ncbi:hypothetical protein GCM10009411_30020 [Shewanella litoralis]|uniref:Uncharacterized protein n=1 Tax=Shewanella litoralis TaxID=2282700 RepID=A0ABQ2REN1_9GAMM|nr:hypothetical protein GCM10009411_30020 [Shewanella litoralis]
MLNGKGVKCIHLQRPLEVSLSYIGHNGNKLIVILFLLLKYKIMNGVGLCDVMTLMIVEKIKKTHLFLGAFF